MHHLLLAALIILAALFNYIFRDGLTDRSLMVSSILVILNIGMYMRAKAKKEDAIKGSSAQEV
ncbi:hypothetical protein [Bacillus infantis]|jgi:hypothetical protein|uniref:hypothetical protein n=1 Tax=Bacillus infantis TaxID=324767 RepID=UPI002155C042|nr:hypothetical protein [Bacillus infantis]MCR6609059.1 hypothetical protein [Bacillus infantis]